MNASPLLGERTRRRFSFLINFFFWALWITLLLAAGRLITRLLAPFVAAFLLAAALQRPLRALENRLRWQRRFASLVLVLSSLCLIGGLLSAVCWQGGRYLMHLVQQHDPLSLLHQLGDMLQTLFGRLSDRLPQEFSAWLESAGSGVGDALSEFGASLVSRVSGAAMSFTTRLLPRFFLALLFFVLAAVFFSRDFPAVTAFLKRQIPPPQRPLAQAAVRALSETCVGTVRAYLVLGMITFLELAAGLTLLRLPHSLLLAGFVALVDILPILGVGTVLLPMSAFWLITGHISGGIGLLVLYAAVTAVRNLLQPKLLSRHTGLPPLITLLTMYAGWRIAGITGLLLGPVAAMVVLRLQREGYLHLFR